MSNLSQMHCQACRVDAPKLNEDQWQALLKQVDLWAVQQRAGIPQLEKQFKFRNYASTIAFTVKVAELAESEQHHPDLLTQWGKVTVTWWSHKIKGLHQNDFVMAAKTDELYSETLSDNKKTTSA